MAEDNQSDREIAIGEHAFKAGFEAGVTYRGATGYAIGNGQVLTREQAWSAYTPPEKLCGGGTKEECEHDWRSSDSSFFDLVCKKYGVTD